MTRAFVKEQDVDYLELPERPVSEHPNDVTEAGLAQIENALAAAKDAYAIAQASADRAALAAARRELRYWTARRATARIVPTPADTSEVRFGATVTIDRPIEEVFAFLADGENDPKFSPRVLEIAKTTDGPPGVVYAHPTQASRATNTTPIGRMVIGRRRGFAGGSGRVDSSRQSAFGSAGSCHQ